MSAAAIGETSLHRDTRRDLKDFRIISALEVASLAPVVDTLLGAKSAIYERAYSLYTTKFGPAENLSKAAFAEVFNSNSIEALGALRDGDVGQYAVCLRRIGSQLAQRKVPFSEVAALLHLYLEAVYIECGRALAEEKSLILFSKLSHLRMMLISESYFWSAYSVPSPRTARPSQPTPTGARPPRTGVFCAMVGSSKPMRELFARISAASRSQAITLVVGESGTGKELVARAIHDSGSASHADFVALNCAAVPHELIESELFGYHRGAFSGAREDYLGMFRAADHGTLFLDEITEMSPDMQGKLLRALQERKVRPVGAVEEIPVDIHVIASTNRDPEQAMRSGQLRKDLYYRLQATMIRVPPLRERPEDIAALVAHFIERFSERGQRTPPLRSIDKDALKAARSYSWPGNVRELSNAVENAYTFGTGGTIRLEDLPEAVRSGSGGLREEPVSEESRSQRPRSFDDVERELIMRALESARGNKLRAAAMLKISRKKLYSRLVKYGIL